MMKKALIDQFLLIMFLFFSLIVVGATVSDEMEMRSAYYKTQNIAKTATRALSKHFLYHEDIGDAEEIAIGIISDSPFGNELVTRNNVKFIWRDLTSDGIPDVVTTEISGYQYESFWYKFLEKNLFDIPEFAYSEYVNKENSDIVSIAIRYGGSDAAYFNMIGIYELDGNNCIVNPRLVMVNKNSHAVGDELDEYTDLNTRFFIIADGYSYYGPNITVNTPVQLSNNCNGNTPNITINGVTNAAPIYFQDTEFNADDGYDHMHEVAKTYFDDYVEYTEPHTERVCTRYTRGRCSRYEDVTVQNTWEDWVEYATDNNIDFENDPNDEYIITMEDLPNGGDKDFNDINLDTTKIRIPRTAEMVDIEDGTIVSETIP